MRKDHPSDVNPLGIFLTGIPAGVNEEKIHELFSVCGKIKEIRLIKDKITGALKGFAYVDFETSEAADSALKMDNTQMYGKPIRVQRSTVRSKPGNFLGIFGINRFLAEETVAAVETKEPEFK
jgi:RNA recognition motif-containing protein